MAEKTDRRLTPNDWWTYALRLLAAGRIPRRAAREVCAARAQREADVDNAVAA